VTCYRLYISLKVIYSRIFDYEHRLPQAIAPLWNPNVQYRQTRHHKWGKWIYLVSYDCQKLSILVDGSWRRHVLARNGEQSKSRTGCVVLEGW
jgi:hypothetical protein